MWVKSGSFLKVIFMVTKVAGNMTFYFPGYLHRNILKKAQMENNPSVPWLHLQTGLHGVGMGEQGS